MTLRRYLLLTAGCFAASFAGVLALLGYDLQRAVRHIGRTA